MVERRPDWHPADDVVIQGRRKRAAPGSPSIATPPRWPRALRPDSLLALLTYTALAVWITQGAWRSPSSVLACANGDCVQAAWFLGWVAFAVAHLRDPLTTTYLTPPGHPIGLMWNNSAPLLGLLLAPLTAAAGALVSYNVGIVAGLAGSAWSASLVVGRLTRHAFPAFVAGLIFGFSPWMVGEVRGGHLFLVSLWLVPPSLFLLVRVLSGHERAGVGAGVLLGALLAAQLLISQEVLADALLLGAIIAIGLARTGVGSFITCHRLPHAWRRRRPYSQSWRSFRSWRRWLALDTTSTVDWRIPPPTWRTCSAW